MSYTLNFRRLSLPALAGAALAFPLAASHLRAQTPPAAPALPATLPASRPGPDTVIITVGEDKVTLKEFDMFLDSLNQQDAQMARGMARRAWAESYADMKLLAREAQNRKLDKEAETALRLNIARDQVLAQGMVLNVQETVDDAALKKYFDGHKADLERVSARHILIRVKDSKMPLRPGQKELTDAEGKAKAEAIIAKIKAGEDFGKLAKTESDDLGSGEEGGDLGSFNRGRMVPPFENAAFALKENEISAPVKSDFGYHIIQVTGKFDTFEKLADVIRQQLAPQRTRQFVKDLRGKAKIVLNEQILGPAMPQFAEPGEAAPATPPATAPSTQPAK